jgi:glycosyltransferase involved in cell wall biosynthesis
MPIVTVVMPAWNVAPFVEQAIGSVLAQTLGDLELIVVDDGSTDETAARVSAAADPRGGRGRQANAGSAAARNAGIRLGRAPLIAFLDGDDLWHPTKLERHAEWLAAHPETDLTFSWSRIIDEAGRDTGRTGRREAGVVPVERLLVENVVGNGSAVVLRREALDRAGHFDPALPAAVDRDVWVRVGLLRRGNIVALPSFLTLYRMRSGQITRDWRRMERAAALFAAKMARLAPGEAAAAAPMARAELYRYLAYIAYESGEFGAARAHLRTALSAAPRHVVADRRSWLLAGALAARATLPAGVHGRLDAAARRWRRALTAPWTRRSPAPRA